MASIADFLIARPHLQRRLFFLARRFVPGETIESAIGAVRLLNTDKLTATLDFLGEDVFNEADAAHTTDTYVEMIDAIGNAGVDSNVSVKLSAIGQAIGEDLAVANLSRIIARARPSKMFVRLDMEGSKTVDSTYRIMERVRQDYRHVGPVVQAYLRRAAADVDRHVAAQARVRLCKGAYGEPAEVAIQDMPMIRRNFAELAQKLLAHGSYPGIATHDDYLIDAVRAFVEREKIPPDRFEYQMLYGIRPEKQKAIVASGYRMRVYVPFGTHWAGYFARRLGERKENVYFVLRSLFSR
jgi:proline dehydrogenase